MIQQLWTRFYIANADANVMQQYSPRDWILGPGVIRHYETE